MIVVLLYLVSDVAEFLTLLVCLFVFWTRGIYRGTFIEFRNGMINVSPLGRNATYENFVAAFSHV